MKNLAGLGAFLGVALALGMSSCGSSGGGGSCGTVQPCGGDPTGTWKIVSDCAPGASTAFQDDQCPTATASVGSLSASGTLSFKADKSYTLATTVQGSLTVTLPASCLTSNGVTVTCAQLTQVFQGEAGTANSPFSAASCSGSSSCTCALTLAPTTSTDSGTWSNSGTTTLALTSATGGTDNGGAYCVKDNELHLLTLDMTMPMGAMGTAKITEDIVATRQ